MPLKYCTILFAAIRHLVVAEAAENVYTLTDHGIAVHTKPQTARNENGR
jgi:hypothetical protein